MNKRLKYITGIFLLCIIAISVMFHFPVHIVNAITLEILSDFGIHISVWRIIFEPILGVLLFFNRTLYPVNELVYVLIWVLIVFIGYSIIKYVLVKDKRKRFVFSQIINIPLVVGLWFAVFLLILFMSMYLPSNTIVNNKPNTILVTTHSHSQFSHDGLMSQENLWEWHKYNNIDAFFITDHNTHDKTLDFVNSQRNNEFDSDPLVMCGEEFSGTNHLSLLGLKRKFNTHGCADSVVIDSTRANKGVVIVNHWFKGKHKTLEYYNNLGVDGFEIENTSEEKTYSRDVYNRIKDFCISNNLLMNGGLDFHGYGNDCSIWNGMEIPNWHNLNQEAKEEAFLNIIRTHNQSKLRVLLYKDRFNYTNEYIFWSPIFTFFNYFRTLNIWQVLSWIFWVFVILYMKIEISKNEVLNNTISTNKLLPILGIISAVFMLVLSFVYTAEIENVIGSQNDIYKEYRGLLFYAGSTFLVYSSIVAFFRIFRNKKVISLNAY